MKIYSFALAAAMMIAGNTGFAQDSSNPVVDQFVSSYSADGFTRFEVRSGITQVKIEAYRGDEKVEVILDKATGDILKRETETAGLFDNKSAGVFIRERNRDFLDDDSDDESNDDDDDLDDDSYDADDDNENDDDSNGTDDGSDDSGDDNGGDRNGSDDNGSDDGNDDDDSNDDNGDDDSNDDSNDDDDNGGDDSSDD